MGGADILGERADFYLRGSDFEGLYYRFTQPRAMMQVGAEGVTGPLPPEGTGILHRGFLFVCVRMCVLECGRGILGVHVY